VLLFGIFWASASVMSAKLFPSPDPDFAKLLRIVAGNGIAALLTAGLSLIVPELRRSLPILYSRQGHALLGRGRGANLDPVAVAALESGFV
jgi:drug/metabolite transporter (DMT)-like permease